MTIAIISAIALRPLLLSLVLLLITTISAALMTTTAYAQYGGTGASVGSASPEQLQECDQLQIPHENCNDVTILAKRRLTAAQEAAEVLPTEVQTTLNDTQSLCIQKGVRQCMMVNYQSPTLVVLSGEFLLPSGATSYENPYIWEAVDKLQVNYGFRIDSVTASGLGSKENPSILHLVLSRQE